MDHTGIHEVTHVEHHWLKTCPCNACGAERKRRDLLASPPKSHLTNISVGAAYALGFISRRCAEGSLARRLMLKNQVREVPGQGR